MSLVDGPARAYAKKKHPDDDHASKQAFPAKNSQSEVGRSPEFLPPEELRIRADSQSYDARTKRFIAEGKVTATLNGGLLMADLIEFDVGFTTLYARGSVRFKKGANYFQASSLRYSLLKKTGELKDVYGVLDLENPIYSLSSVGISPFTPLPSSKEIPLDSHSSSSSLGSDQKEARPRLDEPKIACPPLLPPLPDWQPREWP